MQDFILFFEGMEGTSAVMRLLDKFEEISIIRTADDLAWEPFSTYNCGPMANNDLKQSLDILLNKSKIDFNHLNQIYTKTASKPLVDIGERKGAVGFKMRFYPTDPTDPTGSKLYAPMIFELLKRNNIMVFMAVRQDVLRLALSRYHGDGSGKAGFLQFKLAKGKINREHIGKIKVDCIRLEKIIASCEESHFKKRRLMTIMKSFGIQTVPLFYEDFLKDKKQYFKQMLKKLNIDISEKELEKVSNADAYFKKVHSDDISSFVENHEEVLEKFGNRFNSWSSQ